MTLLEAYLFTLKVINTFSGKVTVKIVFLSSGNGYILMGKKLLLLRANPLLLRLAHIKKEACMDKNKHKRTKAFFSL